VNVETGMWICFYCNGTGQRGAGTFPGLISLALNIPFAEAQRQYNSVESRASMSSEELQRRIDRLSGRQTDHSPPPAPPPIKLPDEYTPIWGGHLKVPYLEARGIKYKTARDYQLGYCFRGFWRGRIIIPAYEMGTLLTYQGRSVDNSEPRYMTPKGQKKGRYLFGLDQANPFSEKIALVEGAFDAMACYQAGIPAVALMTKTISSGQINTLGRTCVEKIVIILDAGTFDEAWTIGQQLRRGGYDVSFGFLQSGDPATADPEELRRLFNEGATPFNYTEKLLAQIAHIREKDLTRQKEAVRLWQQRKGSDLPW